MQQPKTTLPWLSPMCLYLPMLMSYFCWSSGPLSLPPDSHWYAKRLCTRVVSPPYFQSIQPLSLFIEQCGQLWCSVSDPGGRKQGEGREAVFITSTAMYSHVRGPQSLTLTRWLTQAPSTPSSPTGSLVSAVGRSAFLCLLDCIFTIHFPCLDMFRYTDTTVLQLPGVFRTVTYCTGLQPRRIVGCST